MKTKGLLRIVVLFFCVIGFSGCNDDESEFSSTEIQQAEVREHKPDEFIKIDELMQNAHILAEALYQLAK